MSTTAARSAFRNTAGQQEQGTGWRGHCVEVCRCLLDSSWVVVIEVGYEESSKWVCHA